jgi:hypothetical protein
MPSTTHIFPIESTLFKALANLKQLIFKELSRYRADAQMLEIKICAFALAHNILMFPSQIIA